MNLIESGWQFWIDRGGTFTDIVARRPDGRVLTHKLLSENPRHYPDAALQGIRVLLDLDADAELPAAALDAVKMGTTVATNALLEREGEPTLLITTRGFADQLRIGYQTRPDLFALAVRLPEVLHSAVLEVDERIDADGGNRRAPDLDALRPELEAHYAAGLRAVAIVFMHAYRYPEHEQLLADLAADIGFPQISTSAEVSPLMKYVARGDTCVVDAYLSPILRRYVARVSDALSGLTEAGGRLQFMQSSGGLTAADAFRGKDAILSGPAAGVVGMARVCEAAGFSQIIGFDMGGTSTDVSHYDGQFEKAFETQVAGVRLRAPMMRIHTVAAGGGSVLHFDGSRYRVGPDSAGAAPGPACYGQGGPLAITDCNVMLGILQPDCFPSIFGERGDQPLDAPLVQTRFTELAEQIKKQSGDARPPEQVAAGFLAIAVENMANAIKKISVQRGHDVADYTLCCFGAAGGQVVCAVADTLGMQRILLHPHAGVLSALGMGLADTEWSREQTVEAELSADALPDLTTRFTELAADGRAQLLAQGEAADALHDRFWLHLRYQGSDTAMPVAVDNPQDLSADVLRERFETAHQGRFGFRSPEKTVMVEALQTEVIAKAPPPELVSPERNPAAGPIGEYACFVDGEWRDIAFYRRHTLPENPLSGPAVVLDDTSTVFVAPGWQVRLDAAANLILERVLPRETAFAPGTRVDPVMLEIFNNLFMSVAEQMGTVLESTAASVNIKERLDFSCAVFAPDGGLVANAPHMPVHLGSMSESIKTVIRESSADMQPGDAYILNAPYNGGTHLPDVTVIKPVFSSPNGKRAELLFYVASRGHHADIGGKTPGSAPADSKHIEEEGVVINNVQLVSGGRLREAEMRELLGGAKYPARNPDMNLADFEAQLAACEKGAQELLRLIEQYGKDSVHAYMQHVQDNAEACVRRVLQTLPDGEFCYKMDDDSQLQVAIKVDQVACRATVDFAGSSPQHPGNFNAPTAVVRAAVLYVLRCLVDDAIPLNEGCLKPITLKVPSPSMISPEYPAAVIAGNVETSQALVDTLLGALGVAAAAQGTMNNFIWGDDRYQYYETICGGTGATAEADGADAVHSHMTNSRLTDPEVLEWRFPVRLESFEIRRGSGGKGRHRGGDGVIRRVRFLRPMTATMLSGHRRVPPYGVDGGEPGAVGENYLEHADGSREKLPGCVEVQVKAGELIEIRTPGGGGFGGINN